MGMISTFLDLTIRVGCHLTYEVTAPTPVVFMLRPRLDDAHLVTVEKRSFEPGLPSNEFQDSHGNLACRSMLKPGHNDIRYDALVAVSNGCRPSVTGFTTTSNIATAQGGRISP